MIKLTRNGEKVVHINESNILSVEPLRNYRDGSTILFMNNNSIVVSEKADQISFEISKISKS